MRKLRIAVVTANGVKAKLLLRDPETRELKTRLTILDGPAPSALNRRGGTQDERLRRQRIEAFIEVIALHLEDFAAREGLEGVVVAAPERMIGDLKAALARAAPVLAAKPKDLLKVADHELMGFLRGELLEAEGVRSRKAEAQVSKT
jgi:hypothetical protein